MRNGGRINVSNPVAEFMDPLRESLSQLKVGLKMGMSHTPLNPTLKLALIPVIRLWIRALMTNREPVKH
jgi:hypothetical protein